MVRRASRSSRAPAVGVVVAVALLAGAIVQPVGRAQPAPELSRAKDLYKSAEAAMKDGRFDDATRDYGAAYELSKDPALFFKIGRANERAGRCDVALIYYARYLRDGKPSEQFTAATKERITACGGDARPAEGSGAASAPGPGSAAIGTPRGAGSASAPGPGSAAVSAARVGEARSEAGSAAAGSASGTTDGSAAEAGSGAALASATPTRSHKIAWVVTGGAIALVTLGGVLAYAANSAENDVRDLYVGFAGRPPTFDAETRKSYDDLVDQGHRYAHLSWASFGLAGAAAVGAAILFATGGRDAPEHARITPIVTTHTAGVAVTF